MTITEKNKEQVRGAAMRESYLSQRVASLKPSGIRRFFDIAATMKDVISLGIGEPDFDTPRHVIDAGIESLRQGRTHYTSNAGVLELRQALSAHLEMHYGVHYRIPRLSSASAVLRRSIWL